MTEKGDRKSKRSQNVPNTPSRNFGISGIENVFLKAEYTQNFKINTDVNIQFDRTLCNFKSQ